MLMLLTMMVMVIFMTMTVQNMMFAIMIIWIMSARSW